MGVYIKSGAKIPKCCAECRYMYGAVFCVCAQGKAKEWRYIDRRHEDCPLVEIKEPHGRLIDADALVKFEDAVSTKVKGVHIMLVDDVRHLAPTVIEGNDE